MSSLRVLLRIAARDARRDRGRSLLVLIMVVLPVAGLVGVITFGDTVAPTVEENVDARMGSADATGFAAGPGASLDELLDALPADTDVEVVTALPGSVAAGGRFLSVQVLDTDLSDDGFGIGALELVEGSLPQAVGEVVVSRPVAEAAGVGPGDVLGVDPLGEVTVTGVVLDPSRLSSAVAVTAAGTLTGTGDVTNATVYLADGTGELASDPVAVLGSIAVDTFEGELPDDAWYVDSRQAIEAQGRVSQGQRWALLVVGGLAGVEVALVAGAAFAVSVRRRQRELGLLAAGGGTTRHVRATVLLTGVTVGVGGALVGAALGVLGAWGLTSSSVVERVLDQQVSGLTVDAVWIVICIAIGAAAAVAGAWWPARSVAHLPVLTALSGRRPVTVPSRRTAVWGIAVAAAGAAITVAAAGGIGGVTPVVFLAGSVLVVLGAGLTSPFLLEQLGKLAGRLPTGPRLAVRDAARFRTRNGPIVTAAMAGLAASVTVATGLGTAHAEDVASYRPSLPETVAVLDGGERSLDAAAPLAAGALDAEAFPIAWPDVVVEGGGVQLHPRVATPDAVERLFGAAAADALARGDVVVRDVDEAGALGTGSWQLNALDPSTGLSDGSLGEVAVTVIDPEPGSIVGDATAGVATTGGASAFPFFGLPSAVVGAEVLEGAGVSPSPSTSVLLVGDTTFTPDQIEEASTAVATVGDDTALRFEEGPSSMMQRVQWAATGIGTLAGLLIVTVAIALAATEARGDARTLASVGAGVRTRRSIAACRALLLSGLGGLLAVPVGLVPAVAILSVAGYSVPVQIPWVTIAIVAVGVPAVTTLGAVVAASLGRDRLARAA